MTPFLKGAFHTVKILLSEEMMEIYFIAIQRVDEHFLEEICVI